jgi:glycosyltransferase involved in cell wall biosynthesis
MNKVAFDISALKLTGGGTATYLRELVQALADLDSGLTYSMLDYPQYFSRSSRVLRKLDTLNRELIWQQLILPARAIDSGASVLHSPAMICPVKCRLPIVMTVLDAYIVRSPQSFPLWQRARMNHLLPRCINRADRIVAISHFTKNEILNLFPFVNEEKIIVTWLGVNSRFKIVTDELKEKVRAKYRLDKPFILSVSTIEPRKNLKTLVKALALLKDRIDHELVLTGSYGWMCKDLYSLISDYNLSDRIKLPGYVDLEDLPAMYNLAEMFVYPSLYEGFGLPPLEAMACGCPVITTNVASLPEVVGNAAMLFDPLDVEQLSFSIERLLNGTSIQNELKSKGLSRTSIFSWEKCARETLAVYNDLF